MFEDHECHSQRGEITEEDPDDQVQRDSRTTQQHQQNRIDPDQDQHIDANLVRIGHILQITNAGRGPDREQCGALIGRRFLRRLGFSCSVFGVARFRIDSRTTGLDKATNNILEIAELLNTVT